jgi:hypothetical protein
VYTPSTRVAPTYPTGYKYQTPLTAMSAGRRCRKAAISTESSMPEGT